MTTDVRELAPDRTSGTRRTGRWIDHWEPEDPAFWAHTGQRVARRNLAWSIFAEHLGFSVWLLWSVSAAMMAGAGFDLSAPQLFWLLAVPNLVGSLLRVPYTFAVPRFGGRNWTIASAVLLLVPTLLFVAVVQRPGTPYWVLVLVAATAGLGGGNFASSMANINFFYPAERKGAALGLNAAGGNLGVAIIQLFLPVVVGGAGLFGLVKAAESGIHLERAGLLYAALAVVAAVGAWAGMDNLRSARSTVREQLSVVRYRHTWVMSFLYVGTFGSFIGYSAAMPLLIKLNFWTQPVPGVEGIGVNFAYFAFLGALVGSVARPFGGWLADRLGGARVTVGCFALMVAGTLGVLATLRALEPVPAQPTDGVDPATFVYATDVVAAVDHNTGLFGWFLLAFLVVFAAAGAGNGSTYRMIPAIWRSYADAETEEGTPARAAARARSVKEASAVIGLAGAVGAIGGFLIPITFGSPWVSDPIEAVQVAFMVFTGFYVVCAAVAWAVYLRRGAPMARAGV